MWLMINNGFVVQDRLAEMQDRALIRTLAAQQRAKQLLREAALPTRMQVYPSSSLLKKYYIQLLLVQRPKEFDSPVEVAIRSGGMDNFPCLTVNSRSAAPSVPTYLRSRHSNKLLCARSFYMQSFMAHVEEDIAAL